VLEGTASHCLRFEGVMTLATDEKKPTAEEMIEKTKKGIIDDWSDANPPNYGVSLKQKVVNIETHRNRRK